MVITELGMLPCTSVPVVLRVTNADTEMWCHGVTRKKNIGWNALCKYFGIRVWITASRVSEHVCGLRQLEHTNYQDGLSQEKDDVMWRFVLASNFTTSPLLQFGLEQPPTPTIVYQGILFCGFWFCMPLSPSVGTSIVYPHQSALCTETNYISGWSALCSQGIVLRKILFYLDQLRLELPAGLINFKSRFSSILCQFFLQYNLNLIYVY